MDVIKTRNGDGKSHKGKRKCTLKYLNEISKNKGKEADDEEEEDKNSVESESYSKSKSSDYDSFSEEEENSTGLEKFQSGTANGRTAAVDQDAVQENYDDEKLSDIDDDDE